MSSAEGRGKRALFCHAWILLSYRITEPEGLENITALKLMAFYEDTLPFGGNS